MPVDAIGGALNAQDTGVASNNTINQNDFIKLFLTQLQFQDPMEPVDNREFLAQLAQFSNLEQTRETSQNTEGLLKMNSSAQALGLLSKIVTFHDGNDPVTAKVITVRFTPTGPVLSTQNTSNGQVIDILLSQVEQVTPSP